MFFLYQNGVDFILNVANKFATTLLMNQANNVFLITFALITFGYLIKRMDYISEKEGKVLSTFMMHTTFPALMLVSTIRMKLEVSLSFIPLASLFFGSTLLVIAWLVFKKYDFKWRGLLIMGAGGFNTGLFGFPLIEGIWGRDALMYAIMYDIGNLVVVFGLVYTVGSYFA
jgi:malate permease and related proteins